MKTFVNQRLVILALCAVLNFVFEAHGDELLTLTPGRAVTVKIPENSKSALVGFVADPGIADAYLGLKNTFVFVGKKVGTTNFIAVDNETGIEVLRVILVVQSITDGDSLRVYKGKDKPVEHQCNGSNCVLLGPEEAPSAAPPN
jgi:Flp pilus assembly secretin CpaC